MGAGWFIKGRVGLRESVAVLRNPIICQKIKKLLGGRCVQKFRSKFLHFLHFSPLCIATKLWKSSNLVICQNNHLPKVIDCTNLASKCFRIHLKTVNHSKNKILEFSNTKLTSNAASFQFPIHETFPEIY